MTATETIQLHTDKVNARNRVVSAFRAQHGIHADFPDTVKADLSQSEKQISILGQIHNHRISDKSRRALNLT